MEYIKEIIINEAIIHILDNNGEEPVLNQYTLQMNEEIYGFLFKHIERCLKDEELKYAVFSGEKNMVKEISQEYLNGTKDIFEVSKELTDKMFKLMKTEGNIYSCDLVIAAISTEYGPMLAVLKMDYIKNYTHSIDFVDDKIGINIVPELTGLPVTSGKIQKAAFIKAIREDQEFNLMIIDKQSKSKDNMEYGSDYFTNKYLVCASINNERDLTKTFVKAAEDWTRASFEEDADSAEVVRSSIKKKLKEEEKIDINSLAEDMFGDNTEIQESFKEYISSQGLDSDITVDKQWVEKKLKRVRLKIDKQIDLYINEDAYYDNSKFEIQRVGDGSINILIKHVRNYTEK